MPSVGLPRDQTCNHSHRPRDRTIHTHNAYNKLFFVKCTTRQRSVTYSVSFDRLLWRCETAKKWKGILEVQSSPWQCSNANPKTSVLDRLESRKITETADKGKTVVCVSEELGVEDLETLPNGTKPVTSYQQSPCRGSRWEKNWKRQRSIIDAGRVRQRCCQSGKHRDCFKDNIEGNYWKIGWSDYGLSRVLSYSLELNWT